MDFAHGMLEYLEVSFRVEGAENLPDPAGRYIFVANHPLGGPDGIILISFLGQKYSNLKFPVNDLLLNLKNLNNIFLPVNKHGALAKDAVTAIENAYASDCQMIMFPAGMVSRKTNGVIQDPVWQKSFVTKAIQYQRGHCTHLHRRKKFEFLLQSGKFPQKNTPEPQFGNALPA